MTPPKAPISVIETGISIELLQKLIAKILHFQGTMTPTEISNEVRLSIPVVNEVIQSMQALHLIEAKGLVGNDIKGELRYALGGAGFKWVIDALEQSKYVGPAPVPLQNFIDQIRLQTIANETLLRKDLVRAMSHLVISEEIFDKIGPAVNSSRSILLYGDPGNGKTSIAEAIGKAFKNSIHLPFCFEIGGQIINFFDPTIHSPIEDTAHNNTGVDTRWQLCRRPFILTGGELTLEMLDLTFNQVAGFYEAPVHFKATNGVFVVDDFGRQRTDPQSVLNRWIVPLERRYDYLTLHTGKKFAVPFDQLAIFSTNKEPHKLADEAGLRRLHYKLKVPTPTNEDYKKIFIDAVNLVEMMFDENVYNQFFDKYYVKQGVIPAGHHPKYLINYIISHCRFKNVKPSLTLEGLNSAWENLHTR